MRVEFEKKDGLLGIREVPADASPEFYRYGIEIGPPDLSSLELSKDLIKELNNRLVKARIVCYEDTQGQRGAILDIVKRVTGKKNKTLVKQVLALYQGTYLDN